MSNNEHTPGPWKALTRDPLFSKRNRFDILLTADEDMSSQSWASVIGPNSEADARLIAAAPELLGALLEFEAVVGSLGWCAIGGTESDLFTDFYSLATSAIHKAIKG